MARKAVAAVCVVAALVQPSSAQVTDPVTSDINVNCGACKGLFDELDYMISKVPNYAKIDLGNARMDSTGKMTQKMKSYARSEVHLIELLEDVCEEMRNYSGFTEDLPDGSKRTIYHRYQNRPEEKGPLKLQKFGWSLVTQNQLRLACDAIAATIEEELIEAYMNENEVPYKKKACKYYCDKANMAYMLNAWYGLDVDGNPLAADETEYDEHGRVDAKRLRVKNQKELDEKAEEKKKKRKKKKRTKKKSAPAEARGDAGGKEEL
mmetsp:Transcript_8684/g.22462  ORF Transcript_8684/g.22462 Transcript_8684/m.22462 type:complete len:264 (+) Transcript_8684:73-864(+)